MLLLLLLVMHIYFVLQVKGLALELAEMHSFLQRRQNEESRVQQEIQDAFKEISK